MITFVLAVISSSQVGAILRKSFFTTHFYYSRNEYFKKKETAIIDNINNCGL